MIECNTALGDAALRANIAIATAEYERINGPVQTDAIRQNWKPQNFQLANPENPRIQTEPKPKPVKKPRERIKHAPTNSRKAAQALKVVQLRLLAADGKCIKEIAAALGWSEGHVSKMLTSLELKAAPGHLHKRDSALQIVREMAAAGRQINDIAHAAKINTKTVMAWLNEYGIKRGPKMDLSA